MSFRLLDGQTGAAAPAAAEAGAARNRIPWDRLKQNAVFPLVIVGFAATGLYIPGFFGGTGFRGVIVLASILGLASLGQTFTVILGGLDLSIPGVIAVATVVVATATAHGVGFPFVALLLVGLAAVVGALNGGLSVLLGVPSLIVTLGTGSVLVGLALYLNQGSAGGAIPPWISASVSLSAHVLGIPLPGSVLLWLVVALVIIWLQRSSRLFKWVYATGMRPRAAVRARVGVRGVWIAAYVLSALSAVVAGVLLTGFSGGGDVSVGQPYEFLTIEAVVVGGTSLIGGVGGYGKTVAGALLLTDLTTVLLRAGVNSNIQNVIEGVIIVGLLALYGREEHVRRQI